MVFSSFSDPVVVFDAVKPLPFLSTSSFGTGMALVRSSFALFVTPKPDASEFFSSSNLCESTVDIA